MNQLPKLNFPTYKFRFKKGQDGGPLIFDVIRKKWLVLTPEEWVRQNLNTFLITKHNYPASLFKVETELKVNQNQRRSDVVVYKENQPYILIECKAPNVKISSSVLDQALAYNTQYNCPFIILSNGLNHISLNIGAQSVEQLSEFPNY